MKGYQVLLNNLTGKQIDKYFYKSFTVNLSYIAILKMTVCPVQSAKYIRPIMVVYTTLGKGSNYVA